MMRPFGNDYPLLVIVGPTASGKSALALTLAERLGGEIVNYDSVQVYRGFDIGAGKVPPEERRSIAHHLLDCLEPDQVFTAGDYRRAAMHILEDIRGRRKLPVLVGGTGLYLRALLQGLFEGPGRSEELRARLRGVGERRGREHLHHLLRRLDAAAAAKIQPRDTQKIIRALEVCLLARQPLSALHARGRAGLAGFRDIKIGLNPDRARLYHRIDLRVEGMFAQGLMDETRALLTRFHPAGLKPLGALGYRQACAALRGELSLADAVRETQAATRRYAKRQMTWFRRETDIHWFEGFGDDPELQRQVLRQLAQGPATGWGAAARPENSELSLGPFNQERT
jgi:tRNA dimethylallyltransferase